VLITYIRPTRACWSDAGNIWQSDLAREALKDPYIFDFLGLTEGAKERDIEQGLSRHITRFLLELGAMQ